jgi:hypothetical protein
MAYSETRTVIVTTKVVESKTLNTSTIYIDVPVPAGVTSVTGTINGSATNLTFTLNAGLAYVRITATATTQAVTAGHDIAITCTHQKQYGLEAAYGVEHTVAYP